MSEADQLRSIPLARVLALLGVTTQWKRRSNGELYGACPLHESKKNQTSFSFTDSVFHCFSCEAKGKGAIDLVKAYRACNFTEAVAWLKDASGSLSKEKNGPVEPSKPSEGTLDTRTENEPFKGSYEKFYKWPCEWLENRIPRAVLDHFGVGLYHNPSRKSPYTGKVMLPIRRHSDGEMVGYLARTIAPTDGQPKYVFPKAFLKSFEVYGAWEIAQAHSVPVRVAYLVESPFAVMKFHSLGLPAVSCFGWSISQTQADVLAKLAKGWIYLPDRNKFDAVHSSLHLLARHSWVRLPELPTGTDDPEHMSTEQLKAL